MSTAHANLSKTLGAIIFLTVCVVFVIATIEKLPMDKMTAIVHIGFLFCGLALIMPEWTLRILLALKDKIPFIGKGA